MYFLIGYTELQFADMYCSGVPLSRVVNGTIVYGAPITTRQMYDSALVHLDSALTFLSECRAATISHCPVAHWLGFGLK